MKAARTYVRIHLVLLILLLCPACGISDGGREAEFAVDVEALGEQLYQELEFRDRLEEIEPSVVYALLGIDKNNVVAQKNYFSSGATAEEIIVFQSAGKDEHRALLQALESRIEAQKEVYASYAPEEVSFLKAAVLEEKGSYLVYCVAADGDAAKKLISGALQGQ